MIALARRRRRLAVAAAALVVVGAATLILLIDRQDGKQPTARASPSPTPSGETGPRVAETIRNVGFRPRGIAIANGDLWVISALRARLVRIDTATLRRHGTQTRVGRGAVSVTAHRSVVWVVVSRQRRVLQIDAESGKVVRRLPVPVTPILAAAGSNGLWVVGHEVGADPDILFHYDLDGGLLGQTELPQDATALTLGGGRAWVSFDGLPRLFSYDARPRVRSQAYLSAPGTQLAYGAGRVWASVPEDDSVAFYDPRTNLPVTNEAGRRPAGLAVAGGRVFVASYTNHTVVTLDSKTGRPVGEPLVVPSNPWAVAAGEGHVWVSGLGANTLTRIDY